METITPELRNGERQVAPTLAGIRADHVARYRWAVEQIEAMGRACGSILDLGCGVGYGSHILAEAFRSASVFGIDASVHAIGYARLHWSAGARPAFVAHDLTDILWLGSLSPVDAIVLFEIIEHLADPLPVLRAALRLLNPGGLILLSVPNEDGFPFRSDAHPHGVRFHHRHYRAGELAALMQEAGCDWQADKVETFHQTGRESAVMSGGYDETNKARTLVVSWRPAIAAVDQPLPEPNAAPEARSATVLIFQRADGELILSHPWPDVVALPADHEAAVKPETGPLIRLTETEAEYAVANGSAIYERRGDGTGDLLSAEWTDPAMPRGGPIVEELMPALTTEAIFATQPWPQRIRLPLSLPLPLVVAMQGGTTAEVAALVADGETIRFVWANGHAFYRVLQRTEAFIYATRLPGATWTLRPLAEGLAGYDWARLAAIALGAKPDAAALDSVPQPAQPAGPFDDHPARGKRVAILGMGPSLVGYLNLVRSAGGRRVLFDEAWAVNALGDIVQCDRVFHMDDALIQEMRAAAKPEGNIATTLPWLRKHPGPIYTSVVRDGYPGMIPYPVADVINATGHIYFNSTVAWAVAYAVAVGAGEISLFGCDFAYPKAHKAEKGRACVEFWLAVALERGIKVVIAEESSLLDTIEGGTGNLYGFDAVDVRFDQQRDGSMAVTMTQKAVLPTAEQIEEAYDHGIHPNALMRFKRKEQG